MVGELGHLCRRLPFHRDPTGSRAVLGEIASEVSFRCTEANYAYRNLWVLALCCRNWNASVAVKYGTTDSLTRIDTIHVRYVNDYQLSKLPRLYLTLSFVF